MEPIFDLLIMGVGAGLSGTIGGLVNRYIPGVPPGVGGVLAGGAMWMAGGRIHPMAKKFGAGILIASIGTLIAGAIARTPAPVPILKGSPEIPAQTVGDYLRVKYGLE